MQQCFIDESIKLNEEFQFSKEQAHHLGTVLRMRNGDMVKIVDGDFEPYYVTLRFENKNAYGLPYEKLNKVEEKIEIRLIQGMIKKDKWDFLIQKCCELGVSTIVPMISSRTIVRIDEKDGKKLERYNKIAKEACEQCKRDTLVQVKNPISFKNILEYKSDLNIVAYEDQTYNSSFIKNILIHNPNVKTITFVIGSEGGFTVDEIEYLVDNGFQCASLGSRILRAETAAMYVVGTTMFQYE